VYKYIVIDCPPSLGMLTLNSLAAAHSVIIPLQCEFYALEGLGQLLKTIELIKQSLNSSLALEGVLLTMYDSRVNLSQQVISEIKKYFGDKVYNTYIPRTIRLAEAPSYGKSIITYDKSSRGAVSYLDFTKEFLTHQPGGLEIIQQAVKQHEKKAAVVQSSGVKPETNAITENQNA
jgi:chromosome partitioning protein